MLNECIYILIIYFNKGLSKNKWNNLEATINSQYKEHISHR